MIQTVLYKDKGVMMSDETFEVLAQKLIRRMGRSQAMQICQKNQWHRVLEFIKMGHNRQN